ncbi:MAG: DUF4282 domain-containing protein [Peptococcaceae bacterium]|jgi:hypothetical protein|nr:DUF4282 domain-containing protein [Peptococcaceae bacterium]
MDDFFSFRKMVTPMLIKVIYILGEIGIIIGCISGIVAVRSYSRMLGGRGVNFGAVLGGLLVIAISSLFWRVVCESLIVLFSLHSELAKFHSDYITRGSGLAVGSSMYADVSASPYGQPQVHPQAQAQAQAQAQIQAQTPVLQYCPNCNEPASGAFCRKCGQKLP